MGRSARLPAHLAKNTAGLKPDPPPSGLLRAAGSLTPGTLPTLTPRGRGRSPYRPQDRMQTRPQSQGGLARESQPRAQSRGLHFTPALS